MIQLQDNKRDRPVAARIESVEAEAVPLLPLLSCGDPDDTEAAEEVQ
jgi:hypothetical protein